MTSFPPSSTSTTLSAGAGLLQISQCLANRAPCLRKIDDRCAILAPENLWPGNLAGSAKPGGDGVAEYGQAMAAACRQRPQLLIRKLDRPGEKGEDQKCARSEAGNHRDFDLRRKSHKIA